MDKHTTDGLRTDEMKASKNYDFWKNPIHKKGVKCRFQKIDNFSQKHIQKNDIGIWKFIREVDLP
jgi:hypothetical protein